MRKFKKPITWRKYINRVNAKSIVECKPTENVESDNEKRTEALADVSRPYEPHNQSRKI